MTKQLKDAVGKLPYYTKIQGKGRYSGIKAKAWSILSDYVRMRDFIKYGHCISSGKRIENWRDTDAGHYESMGGHGALIGFSPINIHAQSKNDNQMSSMATGARYRDNLALRYGEQILIDIEKLKHQSVKADDWFFLSKIEEIYKLFQELKNENPHFDYPEYIM